LKASVSWPKLGSPNPAMAILWEPEG